MRRVPSTGIQPDFFNTAAAAAAAAACLYGPHHSEKKAREGAGEYGQYRQLQVRRPYIGRIHLCTRLHKLFSGRHKLIFGPRATAREIRARVFFLFIA